MRIDEKVSFFVICALFLAFPALVGAEEEDLTSPVGYWQTVTKDEAPGIIKVTMQDGKISGQIVKILSNENSNPLCEKCEGALKNVPIVGLKIVENLAPIDKDTWGNGQLLDTGSGKYYKVKVMLIDGGKRLKLRGYIGAPLFGRTQYCVRTTAP
jgi:uncharacterized protein (DUF2147 family)